MNAERPLISVVTANYNGALHLREAIESVLGQSVADLELIVSDDASTDGSVAIVRRAARSDPRVRLVEGRSRSGPGAARNRALCAARGRWIAVFDGDDLMAVGRLAQLVAKAEAHRAEIVADNLLAFEDGEAGAERPFLAGREFEQPRWITLAEVVGSSRMYSRRPGLGYLKPLISADALRRVRVRYDERLRIGEDYEFLIRLMANGLKLRFEPAALYRYRRHAGSTSGAMRREHLESMLTADAAFEGDFPTLPGPVRRALAARRASLERALVYDHVVAALKSHDLASAVRTALPHPGVWPMMAMPIEARLKRLAAGRRLGRRAAVRQALA